MGNAFSWYHFIPRKIVTNFSLLLTLEPKSWKISDNFLMYENKSGKYITNIPAISKNEEKGEKISVDKKSKNIILG